MRRRQEGDGSSRDRARFRLAEDSTIYKPVSRSEADAIAARIPSVSLAYDSKIKSVSRAIDLWRHFLALFDGQEIQFASNAAAQGDSWTPATQATFDRGILVLGTTKAGCLWVEEED